MGGKTNKQAKWFINKFYDTHEKYETRNIRNTRTTHITRNTLHVTHYFFVYSRFLIF
jgi:hypothetical protein